MMVKCPKCEALNPDGTVFCKKCGSKFPKELSLKRTTTGKEIAGAGATISLFSSMPFAMGLVSIVIGMFLTFTVIGAIIGIPLIIAGIILVIVGVIGFLGGIGAIIGGGMKGATNKLKEKEQATKERKVKQKSKTDWKLVELIILGIILLPAYLIGVIPLYFAYRRWKRKAR